MRVSASFQLHYIPLYRSVHGGGGSGNVLHHVKGELFGWGNMSEGGMSYTRCFFPRDARSWCELHFLLTAGHSWSCYDSKQTEVTSSESLPVNHVTRESSIVTSSAVTSLRELTSSAAMSTFSDVQQTQAPAPDDVDDEVVTSSQYGDDDVSADESGVATAELKQQVDLGPEVSVFALQSRC